MSRVAEIESLLARARTELLDEKIRRVNHYADAARVVRWIRDPKRAPAAAAFTEGPERQVAYAVEDALRRRRRA